MTRRETRQSPVTGKTSCCNADVVGGMYRGVLAEVCAVCQQVVVG
jgi:hypothetical protein